MIDKMPALASTPANSRIFEELDPPVFLRENPFLRAKLLAFAIRLLRARQSPAEERSLFSFLCVVLTEQRALALVETALKSLRPGTSLSSGTPQELEERLDLARQVTWSLWGSPRAQRHFCQRLITALEGESARQRSSAHMDPEGFETRFAALVRFFNLNPQESEILILTYLVRVGLIDPYRPTGVGGLTAAADRIASIATATGIPYGTCTQLLTNTNNLRRCACLDDELDFGNGLDLFLSGLNKEPIASNFFVRHIEPPLPWVMHGKLAEQHGEWLKTLLRQRDPNRGFNILLYGEPGTGKTSFAVSLAAELGLDLYRIKKGDESRRTPELDSRLTALYLCSVQVDPTHSLIMIDEADRVLRGQADDLAA